jgi:hypothetical protein
MTLITVNDVRGWVETTKLNITTLDLDFLPQLEAEILAQIGTVYDVTGWVDPSSTPPLVKVIITKAYAAWIYDRAYSENQGVNNEYADMLRTNSDMLIAGLLDGTIELPGVTPISAPDPSFYPTDASSALEPTTDDPSLGPARFSLGKVF